MMGNIEKNIETDLPKGKGSGCRDIDVAEREPHQQKFESMGNTLGSCRGGRYFKAGLRDSGHLIL